MGVLEMTIWSCLFLSIIIVLVAACFTLLIAFEDDIKYILRKRILNKMSNRLKKYGYIVHKSYVKKNFKIKNEGISGTFYVTNINIISPFNQRYQISLDDNRSGHTYLSYGSYVNGYGYSSYECESSSIWYDSVINDMKEDDFPILYILKETHR